MKAGNLGRSSLTIFLKKSSKLEVDFFGKLRKSSLDHVA
jgi:hypothetical protein